MVAETAWLVAAADALGRHALLLFFVLLLLLPAAAGMAARRLLRGSQAAGHRNGNPSCSPISSPSCSPSCSPICRPWRTVAATVGVSVFATLATALMAGNSLRLADLAFANAVRASLPAAALPPFAALTHLADTATLTGLSISMALLMAALRQPALALGWALALAGNGVLTRSLKAIFGRARPLDQVAAWAETGFSFPSGHSSGAVVACGMLAYTVLRLLPARWHAAALAAAVALALTIGASRVFLGVHFASDVIAGFASGGLWLLLCTSVLTRHTR